MCISKIAIMFRMLKYICPIVLAAVLQACVRNDIPYPVVELSITSVSGEGFTCNASDIDAKNRTAVIHLDETSDMSEVVISEIGMTEGATADVDFPGTFDMRSELHVILELYQQYEWIIIAEQEISRAFRVEGQIGNAEIDVENRIVKVRVPDYLELKSLEILEMKLGPEGITTMDHSAGETLWFDTYGTVRVHYHDTDETWYLYVEPTDILVNISSAVPGTRVMWLSGSGVPDTDLGFRYRKSGESRWTDVADEDIEVAFGSLFPDVTLVKVDRNGGARRQRERGERGHRRREQQHYHQPQERGRQIFDEHRGHKLVVISVGHRVDETGHHAAHEVRPATHYCGKHSRDYGTAPDCGGILYRIELVNGLRHPPHTEGGQAHQYEHIEELVVEESAARGGGRVGDEGEVGVGKQRGEPLSPVHLGVCEQHHDGDDDADNHDDALDEVGYGSRKVAAEEEVDGGQPRKDENAPGGVDAERRLEDVAHALIDRRRIRQQEDENRERGEQLDILALVALFKKLGHRARAEGGGHALGARGEHDPGGEGAYQHIADAYPHRGEPEIPAELARVAHKDDGGEVCRAVSESAQPAAHAFVGEHKSFHTRALPAGHDGNDENDRHINGEYEPLRPDFVCR